MKKNSANTFPQDMSQSTRSTPFGQEETNSNSFSIDDDLEEFKQEFPEVYALALSNAQCIPQQVWEQVRTGISLTEAFRLWLDKQQPLNLRNTRRCAGSMRCAGRNTAASDPFLRGFHSNDKN